MLPANFKILIDTFFFFSPFLGHIFICEGGSMMEKLRFVVSAYGKGEQQLLSIRLAPCFLIWKNKEEDVEKHGEIFLRIDHSIKTVTDNREQPVGSAGWLILFFYFRFCDPFVFFFRLTSTSHAYSCVSSHEDSFLFLLFQVLGKWKESERQPTTTYV
jgi:hypothetical protein